MFSEVRLKIMITPLKFLNALSHKGFVSRICGQHPFNAVWAPWLLICFAMFFKKKGMWDLLFHFIFTTSKKSNIFSDRHAEICCYKGKHLLHELQLEGSCVGHSEGDFLHLAKCFSILNVSLGQAEERDLSLGCSCDQASWALLGCLVAAGT